MDTKWGKKGIGNISLKTIGSEYQLGLFIYNLTIRCEQHGLQCLVFGEDNGEHRLFNDLPTRQGPTVFFTEVSVYHSKIYLRFFHQHQSYH